MNTMGTIPVTRCLSDGTEEPFHLYSWLSETAWQFIAHIESHFGPRDSSFNLISIQVQSSKTNRPQLWFPDSGIPPNDPEGRSRQIVIRLSPAALNNPLRAKWQLAHECFHLLDPWNKKVDGRDTNRLEEGLATWYQNTNVPEASSHEGSYALAESLVMPQADKLPSSVRHIRENEGLRIGEITPAILNSYCPGFDEDSLRKLCEPFS